MSADEALDSVLRNAGLRPTRQRIAVLRSLVGRGDAITAIDLHHELRGGSDAPGLATIYRTLSALAEAGEVDAFPRDGEQAFRLCGTRHHHHLVCESCGGVQEVEGAEIEAWVSRVAKRRRFTVRAHTADIYGLCSSCA